MASHSGMCVGGPRHGDYITEFGNKFTVPVMKAPSMFIGELPDYDEPVQYQDHEYVWDEINKVWVHKDA